MTARAEPGCCLPRVEKLPSRSPGRSNPGPMAAIDGRFGRPAGQNVHRLLPWDRDSTFQAIDWAIFPRVEDNILVQRALSFSDLRSTYLDVLEQCARAAIQDGWLDNEVSRVSALIADSAHA